MATYEARTRFLKSTGVTLGEYEKNARNTLPTLLDAVKKVNVSSAYAVYNRIGNTVTEINANVRMIDASLDSCIAEFRKNQYNVGDYTALMRDAAAAIEENTPAVFAFEEISLNSDGNEDMTQANLDTINDILSKFMRNSSDALLEVSHARGPMKGEDNAAISNIGKNLENFTNSVIRQNQAIITQVTEMGQEYGLEVRNLEAATEVLSRMTETDAAPEIAFTGGEV